MDTNRKNNDCYFYYYSTCMKGDSCLFRHEENALGCEEVCSHWQQGKCFNQRCNLRHMELKKNRKAIPCYWESKPTGCCKPHCPFRHDLPRTVKNKEGSSEMNADSANHTQPKRGSQGSESSFGNPPVDPLVVNFEEESDNESVPSSTPQKKLKKGIHVKTLEEIRLEKIQAESAAFYRIPQGEQTFNTKKDLPFKVMTLEEIRRAKRFDDLPDEPQLQPDSTTNIKGPEEDLEPGKFLLESEEKNYMQKPVKLRRFFKRSADESISNIRSKIKRAKVSGCVENDDSLSNFNVNESENISMLENDDLLKSIDDLLCD